MADDWEPRDGEGDDAIETLSDEDRKLLQSAKSLRMGAEEIVARARRDRESESTRERPQPKPAERAAAPAAEDIRSTIHRETEAAAIKNLMETAIEGEIENAKGFGPDTPDAKIDAIKKAVAIEIVKHPEFDRMSTTALRTEIRKETRKALDAERKEARRISGVAGDEERDARLAAQEEATESGPAGSSGGGRRAAAAGGDDDDDETTFSDDQPRFGMGVKPLTRAEVDELHKKDMKNHAKRRAAGVKLE